MSNPDYEFKGKTVLVMGLGRFGGGSDVAEFAVKSGAKVIVTDLVDRQKLGDSIKKLEEFSGIEFHLGSHDAADFENADIVVANPAVPGDNKFLQIARQAGKHVTSQVNIFFERCPAKIIGITGANGKSTTTALTAHLLRSAFGVQRSATQNSELSTQNNLEGWHPQAKLGDGFVSPTTQYAQLSTQYETVWLTGNIGNQPFLTALDKIQPEDLVVIELSSFQIEQLAMIKKAPDVALLTNLTPNHLDRYGTFENYCAAKKHIFEFQKLDKKNPAVSIFNAEDEIAAQWYEKYKSDKGRLCIKFSVDDVSEEIHDCYNLPGRANLSNLAAALAIVKYFGVSDNSIKNSLPSFKALSHRLELVEEINGVRWYNDSKATTPEGAITALEAFDKPIILIAGGYDKHLPFDKFAEKIIQKAKAVILIGQTAPIIAETIQNAQMSLRAKRSNLHTRWTKDDGRETKSRYVIASEAKQSQTTQYAIRNTQMAIVDSLSDAVTLASNLAKPGDIVLLSPACASYDMFENYEQRGHDFSKLVKLLDKSK